jgi:hypothetical protein
MSVTSYNLCISTSILKLEMTTCCEFPQLLSGQDPEDCSRSDLTVEIVGEVESAHKPYRSFQHNKSSHTLRRTCNCGCRKYLILSLTTTVLDIKQRTSILTSAANLKLVECMLLLQSPNYFLFLFFEVVLV